MSVRGRAGGRAGPPTRATTPSCSSTVTRRNVVDAYRYWRRDAVAADLAARAHPFHVAIENFGHDHNIGTVVRTANAFGAAGVHIVGRRRWNRRGAMVTDRYLRLHHHDTVAELVAFARGHGLAVVAVDNVPGARRLETTELPRACLLLFGQEGPGVSGVGPRAGRPGGFDRPVRLHPVDQRGGGRRDRNACLDPAARRPGRGVVTGSPSVRVRSTRTAGPRRAPDPARPPGSPAASGPVDRPPTGTAGWPPTASRPSPGT